jgi:hypothetical protein
MAQTAVVSAFRASNLYGPLEDRRLGVVVITNNGDALYGLPVVAVPGTFTWRTELGVTYPTLKAAIAAL